MESAFFIVFWGGMELLQTKLDKTCDLCYQQGKETACSSWKIWENQKKSFLDGFLLRCPPLPERIFGWLCFFSFGFIEGASLCYGGKSDADGKNRSRPMRTCAVLAGLLGRV